MNLEGYVKRTARRIEKDKQRFDKEFDELVEAGVLSKGERFFKEYRLGHFIKKSWVIQHDGTQFIGSPGSLPQRKIYAETIEALLRKILGIEAIEFRDVL